MDDTTGILIGGGGADYGAPQTLLLKYANRHGLIAGATGTGKAATLQAQAACGCEAGFAVLLADVPGAGAVKPR